MALLTHDQQSRITRGMKSLVSLANNLKVRNHKEVKEDSRHAYEEIEAVNEQLEKQLDTADSQTVDLMDKKALLVNEKKETELSRDLLQIKLNYQEEIKKCTDEIQSKAKKHLYALEKMQEELRKEVKWYKIARNIAMMFMPLSTLMAGIVSAIFQTSLYTAQRADQELQRAIEFYETKVSEYQQNVCKGGIEKKEIEVKLEAAEKKLKEIEEKLEHEKKQQQQLRTLTPSLGLLVVELEILKDKVEDTDYESAWEILETKVVLRLEENLGLFDGKKIRGLLQDLKEII